MRSIDRSRLHLIAEARAKFVRLVGFLLSFGAGKVAIYCVPLAVAAIATPEIYGSMEVAYATTQTITSTLATREPSRQDIRAFVMARAQYPSDSA
jgi:hypothetical protein